ncbi:PEPxxWA-CTERM sorting domain-containing protein [Phenylobacterium sp.]|uniref:PEPxxWA-CTERM sorting domain-containing protein n=1 Tax=Phenylobacterium sp. TaxID=1871053 RepID=UPI0025F00E07|nr:PEPxxWA-CTERM sorting domain-containing protein [Phenylobacterium sp.]
MNRLLVAAVAAATLASASAAGAAEVYEQPLTTPSEDSPAAEAATPAAQSLASLYHLAAAVPEPMTWAMMIVGFGAAGQILRRRRAIGDL